MLPSEAAAQPSAADPSKRAEAHGGKQYGLARQLYLQVLDRRSDHEVAWHNLGLVEHMTGRQPGGGNIGKAIGLKPDYARAYANLAAVLRETRQLEAARETAQRAVRLDPASPRRMAISATSSKISANSKPLRWPILRLAGSTPFSSRRIPMPPNEQYQP